MVKDTRALRTQILPVPFFLRDAKVSSVQLNENELIFIFSSGFYMVSRDGKENKSLDNAVMRIRFIEGNVPEKNIYSYRKIHVSKRRKFKKLQKDIAKQGMDFLDIFFSHHTKTIIIEGKGKGFIAMQMCNVEHVGFEFSERHVKIYDSPIVNRKDVFNIQK